MGPARGLPAPGRRGAVTLPPGLDALRVDPAHAVVALDYDGTLAPIVEDPTSAFPAPGAVAALSALTGRVGTLALVTGRPADVVVELGGLADVAGLTVLGQYGAQRWHDGRLSGAEPLPGVARARTELTELLAGVEGAALEDKGLALVVHTRRCADPAGTLTALADEVREIAFEYGFLVHEGRFVLEVRPPGFDKRGALLSLCDPLPSAVLFAGDDLGDLPAFDAVDELRDAGVPGVCVCSADDEGPPELRARADLVVDGPAGVVALLTTLLDA